MKINNIVIHFNQKNSLAKIAKEYCICRNKLSKTLISFGYQPINYQNNVKLIQSIFDNIDDEYKAYWLGFIYADGSITNDGIFEIQLAEKDFEHLIKFKNFIKWENEIKFKDSTKSVRITFRNKYFTNQLNKLGVVPNKSLILSYPDFIPDFLQRHFIRGYFDGDGCIHFRKCVKKRNVLISLLGTSIFLNSLRDYSPIKVKKLYKKEET